MALRLSGTRLRSLPPLLRGKQPCHSRSALQLIGVFLRRGEVITQLLHCCRHLASRRRKRRHLLLRHHAPRRLVSTEPVGLGQLCLVPLRLPARLLLRPGEEHVGLVQLRRILLRLLTLLALRIVQLLLHGLVRGSRALLEVIQLVLGDRRLRHGRLALLGQGLLLVQHALHARLQLGLMLCCRELGRVDCQLVHGRVLLQVIVRLEDRCLELLCVVVEGGRLCLQL